MTSIRGLTSFTAQITANAKAEEEEAEKSVTILTRRILTKPLKMKVISLAQRKIKTVKIITNKRLLLRVLSTGRRNTTFNNSSIRNNNSNTKTTTTMKTSMIRRSLETWSEHNTTRLQIGIMASNITSIGLTLKVGSNNEAITDSKYTKRFATKLPAMKTTTFQNPTMVK